MCSLLISRNGSYCPIYFNQTFNFIFWTAAQWYIYLIQPHMRKHLSNCTTQHTNIFQIYDTSSSMSHSKRAAVAAVESHQQRWNSIWNKNRHRSALLNLNHPAAVLSWHVMFITSQSVWRWMRACHQGMYLNWHNSPTCWPFCSSRPNT